MAEAAYATRLKDEDCAREPIHVPGAIQPHGYLAVLSAADRAVVAVSENFAAALALSPYDMVGRPIDDFLMSTSGESLHRILGQRDGSRPIGAVMRRADRRGELEGAVRLDGDLIMLELEPSTPVERASTLFYEVRAAIERIRQSSSAQSACEALAAEIRRLTGYERVMIYRFDADWNGQVIAEDRTPSVKSYLGHAFPAADIPSQARALYLRNTFRIIPDARYHASPIIPRLDPSTGRPFDLSDVTLRSVSPTHLEYMTNMGVAASMSVSIIRDNRLWGLVACHHASPRGLPQSVLHACDLLAQATAWYLDTADRNAVSLAHDTVRRFEAEIAQDPHADFKARLTSVEGSLLACAGCDGLAIWEPQGVWATGSRPPDFEIHALASWLSTCGDDSLVTDRLPQLYPPARTYAALASGLFAARLADGWLMWFRAEWRHSVTWAGDPEEAHLDAQDGRINPRRSFASRRRRMRERSTPWSVADRSALEELQALVLRVMMADQMRRLTDNEKTLTEAKLAAEAATQAKTNFLATMSHEIRTPLNGVLGMAQIMANDALDDTQRERLDVIQKSGSGLLAILNDILDMSKIEANRLDLEEISFEIEDVAKGVFAVFEPIASAKDLDLVLDFRAGACGVWRGDPVRIRQLISNLVANALKFTIEGTVTVTVDASDLDGAKLLNILVTDTGIGVSADAVSQLFDPFVQADNTTTRRFGGTGLGLTICRHIAELMGGEIQVRSELGRGTVFDVRLPLLWEGDALARQTPASPESEQDLDLSSLRVLAADDNATNRLVLRAMMGSMGIPTEIVEDGRRAVDAWTAGAFDLVLMDVQMPILNGVDATAEIRRLETERGGRRTPIVAFTANAMQHQVAEYLAAGFDCHLAKPVVLGELYAVLASVAQAKSSLAIH